MTAEFSRTDASAESPITTGRTGELATRAERLLAVLIDGAILIVPMVIIVFILSFVFSWMGLNGGFIGQLITQVIYGLIAAAVLLALNAQLLAKEGQTIGKRMMKIRIVGDDGTLLPLQDLIIKRYVPIWAASLIPYIGILTIIDPLMIFRQNHKCLHDEIAGTKVIMADKPFHRSQDA